MQISNRIQPAFIVYHLVTGKIVHIIANNDEKNVPSSHDTVAYENEISAYLATVVCDQIDLSTYPFVYNNDDDVILPGLIDIDNTKFDWKNYANFKILDSLIHVKNSELVLDGKLEIIIKDSQEIYKTLLTPKNYRTEIEKIELNFNYNFDQKILNLSDIKIDNAINKNVGIILKNLIVRSDKLQNKIYFKNMINKAIKSYAG